MNANAPLEVLIIGAGFGGIGLGVRLRQTGCNSFLILERGDDVGGVWRDNAYPGAACDVPSVLYSFSFEPNPEWSCVYPPQDEILDYLRRTARKHGLMDHLRTGTEVLGATWDELAGLWTVQTTDGTRYRSRLLVSAVGLDNPGAHPRFTFGNAELTGGVSLIPVMVGMFAVSEILRYVTSLHPTPPVAAEKIGNVFKGMWELTKKYKVQLIRGSAIGTAIGVGAAAPAALLFATTTRPVGGLIKACGPLTAMPSAVALAK